MRETLSQQQALKQQQRLMPIQVQFVRMLEMTGPELEAEVARAVEENPALEAVDDSDMPVQQSSEEFYETAEQVQMADYRNDDIPPYMLRGSAPDPNDSTYEHVVANDEMTLAEELHRQIAEMHLSERIRLVADYIIDNLDDNGYLSRDVDQTVYDLEMTLLPDVTPDEVRQAIDAVRTLDPPGIGAADLRDCLLLQLERREPRTKAVDLATTIVKRHFDAFSKHHFKLIANRIGVSDEEFAEALAVIRHLNPKPGAGLGESAFDRSARMIVPELRVDADGESLTVTLLDNIPRLSIAESFADPVSVTIPSDNRSNDAQAFIKSRRDEAQTFIRTITMRQSTLINVMTAIAEIQRDFFNTGDESTLRPMILKDVAARTGYDLSVISRATASRYVITGSGTYPLKYFFNERPNADDDTSIHQISAAIRSIIDAEDKHAPLSDEHITRRLEQMGFKPARRTVSKYRERLGYPIARLRRTI